MKKPNVLIEQALELAHLGKLEDASELIGKLIEEYPDNIEVHDALGEILTLKGEYREAIIPLEKAIATPPIPVETFFNLAVCYEKTHQFIDALRSLDQVLVMMDDKSNYRKTTDRVALKKKMEKLQSEAIEMKRSIDYLLL